MTQIITLTAIPAVDVSTSVGKLAAFSKVRCAPAHGTNPRLPLLGMLVVDGFAEPLYGMPYTDCLGREICVDVAFDQDSAIRFI